MNAIDITPPKEGEKEPENRVIVRVKTSAYHDHRGVHYQRHLNILRRQSSGFDYLTEECSMIGADLVVDMVENFHDVKDGVYLVILTNVKKDWETGHVDSYDFKLIPL